jgi:hypothetical protein
VTAVSIDWMMGRSSGWPSRRAKSLAIAPWVRPTENPPRHDPADSSQLSVTGIPARCSWSYSTLLIVFHAWLGEAT